MRLPSSTTPSITAEPSPGPATTVAEDPDVLLVLKLKRAPSQKELAGGGLPQNRGSPAFSGPP